MEWWYWVISAVSGVCLVVLAYAWGHFMWSEGKIKAKHAAPKHTIIYVGGVYNGRVEAYPRQYPRQPEGLSIRIPILEDGMRFNTNGYNFFKDNIKFDEYFQVAHHTSVTSYEEIWVYATDQSVRIKQLEKENSELTELMFKDATE